MGAHFAPHNWALVDPLPLAPRFLATAPQPTGPSCSAAIQSNVPSRTFRAPLLAFKDFVIICVQTVATCVRCWVRISNWRLCDRLLMLFFNLAQKLCFFRMCWRFFVLGSLLA
ncbi:hypothetical protein M758_3G034200 [Ceratodon purpureus]|uniref:Uncharacterized protein n=1 Tax=Ceratodon purpureus TaxID=3225 RepID=A0A8T0IGS2_CERPU|nr:hypothetical protein KC19_3G035100 [Ceratodon purpureus]KAG0621606.1 hypothetical protein M758_3G034200 [Ceratodon purpureus]